jgi:hypothetical protein
MAVDEFGDRFHTAVFFVYGCDGLSVRVVEWDLWVTNITWCRAPSWIFDFYRPKEIDWSGSGV